MKDYEQVLSTGLYLDARGETVQTTGRDWREIWVESKRFVLFVFLPILGSEDIPRFYGVTACTIHD